MKLCACCFNDEEIRQFINITSNENGVCDYCGEESTLLDAEELLDFFSEFISIFRPENDGENLVDLIQNDWKIFTDNKVGKLILSDILTLIGSNLSSIETKMSYIQEISECVNYWAILKESLKWERRFLTDAQKLDEYGWDSLFNINAEIDSNIYLYRARIHFDGDMTCLPPTEMGSPPKHKASAGRANPFGIPYLYLSKSQETTLYETRANYLDILSVGCFAASKSSLEIVDFTSRPSPFNHEENMIKLAKSRLLKEIISADLSKPLRRFDSELEYIPTQFICEFIRYSTGADGIQFNSSLHRGGVNIVLFDPNRVECIDVKLYQIMNVHISSRLI